MFQKFFWPFSATFDKNLLQFSHHFSWPTTLCSGPFWLIWLEFRPSGNTGKKAYKYSIAKHNHQIHHFPSVISGEFQALSIPREKVSYCHFPKLFCQVFPSFEWTNVCWVSAKRTELNWDSSFFSMVGQCKHQLHLFELK